MAPQSDDVRNGRKANKLFPHDGGIWEATQRFMEKSYAGDYAGLIVLAVLFLFLKIFTEPFHQMFVINDFRISHPWAEIERVDVCKSNQLPVREQEFDYGRRC